MLYAHELLASMAKKRLLTAKEYKGRCKIYVVTQTGRHFAEAENVNTKYGTGWGRYSKEGLWMLPSNFKHDRRAIHLLLFMSHTKKHELTHGLNTRNGQTDYTVRIAFEPMVRRANKHLISNSIGQNLLKIPDGIVTINDRAFWVEVENSRKDGKNMRDLAQTLVAVSQGELKGYVIPDSADDKYGRTMRDCIVVVPEVSVDDRGHRIHHMSRINKAILHVLHDQWREHGGEDPEGDIDHLEKNEIRPMPHGFARIYFVVEKESGEFMIPKHATILPRDGTNLLRI